ncbi:MAG: nucleotide exchange factor GrpE [Candidatus Diapherotrites archaeon]|nr:nucleotide exchange factor GrpE [Candidatus Diapherotrites archaeon]
MSENISKEQGFESKPSVIESQNQSKTPVQQQKQPQNKGFFHQRKQENEIKQEEVTGAGETEGKKNEFKTETKTELKMIELTETLQRLQAEFENYQKRNSKQNEEFKYYANAKLIEELLPVLDALEQGMKHDPALKVVYEQLSLIFKKNGLEKIKLEKGMKFDHETMDCMLKETNLLLKDDVIVCVLVAGYVLNGKILRHAKVSVNVIEKEKKENQGEMGLDGGTSNIKEEASRKS